MDEVLTVINMERLYVKNFLDKNKLEEQELKAFIDVILGKLHRREKRIIELEKKLNNKIYSKKRSKLNIVENYITKKNKYLQ